MHPSYIIIGPYLNSDVLNLVIICSCVIRVYGMLG